MKTDERRRTVSEIIARYELEPSLMDIYVEGAEDKSIVDWFLQHAGLGSVRCFDISDVEMPSAGNESGNRSRVIDLSKTLSEKLSGVYKVACIIDCDFDVFLKHEDRVDNRYLLRTDYSCMEMYFYTQNQIELVNKSCLKTKKISGLNRCDFIKNTLMRMFSLRYINEHLDWRVGCVDLTDCVSFKANDFVFDEEVYVNKYLGRGGRMRDLNKFKAALASILIDPASDFRCYIHGHDFRELLAWVVCKLRGDSRHTEGSIYDLLKVGGCIVCFSGEPLFASLRSRFS